MLKYLLVFLISTLVFGCNSPQNSQIQISNIPAVIGGEEVTSEDLKAATVGVYMMMGNCSGSYIGNNKVVTAAHCISDGAAVYVTFNLAIKSVDCKVVKGVMHPDYEKDSMPWNDIAVLTISCDKRILKVKPYKLADKAPTAELIGAGYGLTTQNGEFTFPRLNQLTLQQLDMNQFVNNPSLDAEAHKEVTDTLAKMAEGMLSCFNVNLKRTMFFGDSGGPMYYMDGKQYVLSSVNSAMYSKRDNALSTIYAFCSPNISYHRAWLLAQ